MKFHQHFLPHLQTHQKSSLLHWHFLMIYLLLFILLQAGFNLVSIYKPGILGVNANITSQEIIKNTNFERQKIGLPPLKENVLLDQAAAAKAKNMFEENYWAHYSPSGKDPWSFINKNGYKFTYAGENLAKNFTNSNDVVTAWMNSPSHRENLFNSRYEDIGVAVVEGVLNGQSTTLVVQMFGTSFQPIAQQPAISPIQTSQAAVTIPPSASQVVLNTQTSIPASNITKVLVNPYQVNKVVSFGLISFLAMLILLDFIVLKKRGVFRFSSHHFAHLSFLALAGTAIFVSSMGEIL